MAGVPAARDGRARRFAVGTPDPATQADPVVAKDLDALQRLTATAEFQSVVAAAADVA